mgnify:CR=1 FL=1
MTGFRICRNIVYKRHNLFCQIPAYFTVNVVPVTAVRILNTLSGNEADTVITGIHIGNALCANKLYLIINNCRRVFRKCPACLHTGYSTVFIGNQCTRSHHSYRFPSITHTAIFREYLHRLTIHPPVDIINIMNHNMHTQITCADITPRSDNRTVSSHVAVNDIPSSLLSSRSLIMQSADRSEAGSLL